MGFRSLFKVRKPGNGEAVQKEFERATRAKVEVKGPFDNSFNSKDKKGVSVK